MNVLKFASKLSFIIVCVALIVFAFPYFNGKTKIFSFYHHIIWGDKIIVKVDSNINLTDVEVVFKNEYQLLLERNNNQLHKLKHINKNYKVIEKLVFENGKQISQIPYDYGKQVLSVVYKKREIGRLFLWKTNSQHSHRYLIDIRVDGDKIVFKGYIEGPDKKF